MIITLQKAGKKYNREWIFRNVDLEITSGDRLVLLGPNGSGKSTFLQMMAGYVLPTEGEIHWKTSALEIAAEKVYQSIAIAAPYLELPEELELMELLTFHFRFKKVVGELSFEELLSISGLKKVAGKPIRNYSSGMKQRVRLLLAFCSNSDLLLLDEPCSNLDQEGVLWYQQLADRYIGNRTVVVCSNRQEQEYSFCQTEIELEQWKK